MKLECIKEQAIEVTAEYRDFDGTLQEWEHGFYVIWRYQMTFSFAYRIEALEKNETGAYIRLLIRPAYEDVLIPTMEDLGYRNIKSVPSSVGVITDWSDDVDFWDVVFE